MVDDVLFGEAGCDLVGGGAGDVAPTDETIVFAVGEIGLCLSRGRGFGLCRRRCVVGGLLTTVGMGLPTGVALNLGDARAVHGDDDVGELELAASTIGINFASRSGGTCGRFDEIHARLQPQDPVEAQS